MGCDHLALSVTWSLVTLVSHSQLRWRDVTQGDFGDPWCLIRSYGGKALHKASLFLVCIFY